MFNTRFNNSFQNMNDPNANMDMNTNGYQNMQQDPYASYYPQDPYAAYNQDPSMMQNIPYPMPPAETNTAYPQGYTPEGYAKGGEVKKKKGAIQNSPYPALAEMIRQQGNGEDTILAHINPDEAMMLKAMGGSGTINKKTGLPQFGKPWYTKIGKTIKSVLGPIGGTILGNLILPGAGGLLGGALGGAAGSAVRGRKDFGQAALRGLGIGAMAPTLAGWAGTGFNSLGATGTGAALTKYGNDNAIMPALSKLFGVSEGSGAMSGVASGESAPKNLLTSSMLSGSSPNLSGAAGQAASGVASAGSNAASGNWYDQLLANSGKFLSKPKNLLTLATVGSSLLNRPKQEKPKTPEQIANEQKRLEKALMLSPEERAAKEAELLAEAKMRRSVERNKFLPTEHFANLEPIHRRSNTPEEQKRSGRWFSYHNNPDFSGEPMAFAEGGLIEGMMGIGTPSKSSYIDGMGGGQDDNIRTGLPDKSYIVKAATVSDLGDGNSRAGANKIQALISNGEYYISPEDVARFGKLGAEKLDSFVKNVDKHKRGSTKMSPKAKPLASYLKK